ncbi:hypothetical protein WJ23_14330 [Burkholderia lata]|nr:hypothetical protein WJ23_14330 [Burkholderia lata]
MAALLACTERVVRDGNLITGGGVTAGTDFALTIAAELAGDEAAQAIQLQLEYAPAPTGAARDVALNADTGKLTRRLEDDAHPRRRTHR